MAEPARARARVPDWAWLAAIVVALGARARRGSLARCRRRTSSSTSSIYCRAREEPRGRRRVQRPRGADERLQPPLPGAPRAGVLRSSTPCRPPTALAKAINAARRCRSRPFPPGSSPGGSRADRSSLLAAAARGRAAVARVHGDGRHGEPLLPARARRSRGRSSGCSSDRRGHGSASSPARSPPPSRPARRRSAFVAAVLVAPLCLALIGRERATPAPVRAALRRDRRARPLVVGAQARARAGRSRSSSAPTASSARAATTSGTSLRFWLWHVEELTLYVARRAGASCSSCCSPAARGSRCACRSISPRPSRSFVASTLVVGAFASPVRARPRAGPVPLLLRAAPRSSRARRRGSSSARRGRWCRSRSGQRAGDRARRRVPVRRFIGEPAKSDTCGLIPLWTANEHLLGGSYRVDGASRSRSRSSRSLAFVPARRVIAVPLVLLGLFLVLSRPVWSGPQRRAPLAARARSSRASAASSATGSTRVPTGDEVGGRCGPVAPTGSR